MNVKNFRSHFALYTATKTVPLSPKTSAAIIHTK